jgi:PRC-barrel domain
VFEAAIIREWRGHDVVDVEDSKIGELEAVYVDTTTDRPAFGTVMVGMPTRHRLVFVPLNQATVGPGYYKVSYDKKQVQRCPLDRHRRRAARRDKRRSSTLRPDLPAGR